MKSSVKKKGMWLAGGLLVIGLMLAVLPWPGNQGGQGSFASRPSILSRLLQGEMGIQPSVLPEGVQLHYRLQAESEIQIRVAQQQQSNTMVLDGAWKATRLRRVDGAVHWLVELQLDELGFSALDMFGIKTEIKPQLEKPFQIVLSEQGAVEDFAFSAELATGVKSILRNLVMQMQFVYPGGFDQKQWESKERDTVGVYLAQYRRPNETRVFEKSKGAYLEFALLKSKSFEVHERKLRDTEYAARFELREDGVVQRASFEEIDFRKGTKFAPEVRTRTEGSLVLQEVSTAPHLTAKLQLAQNLVSVGVWDARGVDSQHAKERHDEDKKRVAGASYRDLLDAYQQTAGAEDPADARIKIFQRLRSLCRLDPRTIVRIRDELIKGETSTQMSSMLTSTLASLNDPRAHQSFVAVLDHFHRRQDYRLADAITGLVQSPIASKQAVEQLRKIAEYDPHSEAGTSAQLNLGVQAFRMREQGMDEYEETLNYLVERYLNPDSPVGKLLALAALGNTGDPSLLSIVQAPIESADVEMREVAVDALRLVDSPEVDPILAKVMQNDPSFVVRRCAVKNYNLRPLDNVLGSLTQVLLHDPQAKVRSTALQIVAARLGDYPNMLPVLEQTAIRDSSQGIRQEATKYIAQYLQQKDVR